MSRARIVKGHDEMASAFSSVISRGAIRDRDDNGSDDYDDDRTEGKGTDGNERIALRSSERGEGEEVGVEGARERAMKEARVLETGLGA